MTHERSLPNLLIEKDHLSRNGVAEWKWSCEEQLSHHVCFVFDRHQQDLPHLAMPAANSALPWCIQHGTHSPFAWKLVPRAAAKALSFLRRGNHFLIFVCCCQAFSQGQVAYSTIENLSWGAWCQRYKGGNGKYPSYRWCSHLNLHLQGISNCHKWLLEATSNTTES